MALERIGPYRIQGILGRGGMGTVYRAHNLETDSLDAVKVLAPNFADDPHFRGRFESEIEALLKLNHRNIVKLLSFGQEDGMLFFSMELVEGNSLYQMQKQGHEFDWRQVISIAQDSAHGLRHAHDRGVIHRDLKPGNLLMAVDSAGHPDHVKLTDFGIAKRFGNSQNTGTNILGTMDFMSPEQAKGEPATVRSDLYSLGSVMFTLLCGRPPFTSNSVEESLRNLTRVPAPRIRSLKPDVPLELDQLISKLMAKRPEERVPTAQALIHQLNQLEEHLRESAQARTAHPLPDDDPDSGFDVQAPKTVADTKLENQPMRTRESRAPATEKNSDIGETALLTDEPFELEPQTEEPRTGQNYFNTVTDHLRGSQDLLEEEEPKSRGILRLTLALLVVLALAVYGTWLATRPPSAESLYATIDENADQPNRVLDEINQFIELYPDEPRIEQIKRMQVIAESIRNYKTLTNTLTVRANTPGGLNEVEQQFMDIAALAEDQPDLAQEKMQAFVTFYSSQPDLTEREHQCIAAATGYSIKLAHERRTSVMANLNRLRAAMKTAEEQPDPAQAIELYRSIVELYRDVDWGLSEDSGEGRRLVTAAAQRIKTLRREIELERLRKLREKINADHPDQDSDAPTGDSPNQ